MRMAAPPPPVRDDIRAPRGGGGDGMEPGCKQCIKSRASMHASLPSLRGPMHHPPTSLDPCPLHLLTPRWGYKSLQELEEVAAGYR